MSSILKPKKNTTFGGLIDKTSYKKILFCIIIIILLFAFMYFTLDIFYKDHGTNKENLTLLDYLYFSVVTFATLGYGDILPIGFSKILVIIEVLSGMFFVAIFIGKISSERQSTKLTLIYSSINHQRILGLIEDISCIENEMMTLYLAHDNKNILIKSKDIYDLVSVIRKYLILHSLEGELAAYGNSSTLRRLYIALAKLQKSISIINKTFGIPENVITIQKRTIISIGEIGKTMKQFHIGEEKIISNLNELVLEMDRYFKTEATKEYIYRTEVTKELLDIINIYKNIFPDVDLLNNYDEINRETGITKKLLTKCI